MDYNPARRPRELGKRGRAVRGGTGTGYMDKAALAARSGGRLQPSHVAVSPTTIDRMVGGLYDWQDGALAKRQRRVLDDGRLHDPG